MRKTAMLKSFFKIVFLLFYLTGFCLKGWSTHIRAGEIIASLIDCQSNTYKFSLIGYTDTGSDVVFGGGVMDFGDGSQTWHPNPGHPEVFQELGDEVALNIFYVTHTFPGPGTYTIRYQEDFRNASIANMNNSVMTPFYVETQITIDPFFGCNNTAILLNPPLDRACVGKAFYHNPGGWDVDGDSLSYEIVVNKQDIDVPVANYRLPNIYDLAVNPDATNEAKTGPPTYTLDPVTGDLLWDAPGTEDEYNIAFIIKEWRYIPERDEWVEIGYVTRDMQIIVFECENERPELKIPADTCIQAGTLLKEVISVDDPDGNPVTVESFGGPYELPISPATYSPLPVDPVNPQPVPAQINFMWQTNCSHVRSRPYQITFKAKDTPDQSQAASLVDFKTWEVTVVGPPPEGLATVSMPGRMVNLTWDQYMCKSYAGFMQIWRRVDSYEFEPEICETGLPYYTGYELIATVPINLAYYVDRGGPGGLAYGATYCYRLVAVYNLPAGGESYVSEESCVTIDEDEERSGPVITRVSVVETDVSEGAIDLEWTPPLEVDNIVFPPPYSYEIYRSNMRDGSGTFSGLIAVSDTFYTDSNLNTTALNNNYSYRIAVYDANNILIDTSAQASSVRLTAEPTVSDITLKWEAHVPWSNNTQKYPFHYIYRNHVIPDNTAEFQLIDSINVNHNDFSYNDKGITGEPLVPGSTYCYYITTQGAYGNPKIREPLLNNSNIICLQLKDTIKPCVSFTFDPDILNNQSCEDAVKLLACGQMDFYHDIKWDIEFSGNINSDCRKEITGYEVWFSEDCLEDSYELIEITSEKSFLHEHLGSYKGCYKIRAIDNTGNVSDFSDVLTFDNCPYYELPNVFTPNQDGKNDVFSAYEFPNEKCPRFIKSVIFKVYNRWGNEIYVSRSKDENILINWDGRLNDGAVVSTGVYYYVAELTLDTLDPKKQNETIKGWIQVFR